MSFNFKDFSDFKFKITPVFISSIFWSGVVLCVISGLYVMTSRYIPFFIGLIIMLLGPIVWRIKCELMIVMFKIHEGVEKMSGK